MKPIDESNIRPIFRSTSRLRKPAAVLGMLWLVIIFPFYATWEMRGDFGQALRELLSVFRR
jgi:hypothetical protein